MWKGHFEGVALSCSRAERQAQRPGGSLTQRPGCGLTQRPGGGLTQRPGGGLTQVTHSTDCVVTSSLTLIHRSR